MNLNNNESGLGNLFQKDKTLLTLKIGKTDHPDNEFLITNIYVEQGATLKKGDPVFEIESNKVTFDIEAPEDGKVVTLSARKGEKITAMQILAFFEVSESAQLKGAVAKKPNELDKKSKKDNKKTSVKTNEKINNQQLKKEKTIITLKIGNGGSSDDEYTITNVYADEGGDLKKDDPVFEVESNKAVFDIYAPADGKITTLSVRKDDNITPLQILAYYEVFKPSQLYKNEIGDKFDIVETTPDSKFKKENPNVSDNLHSQPKESSTQADKKYTVSNRNSGTDSRYSIQAAKDIQSSTSVSVDASDTKSNAPEISNKAKENKGKENKAKKPDTHKSSKPKSKGTKDQSVSAKPEKSKATSKQSTALNETTQQESGSKMPYIMMGFIFGALVGVTTTLILFIMK